jgi:hypothetical protein
MYLLQLLRPSPKHRPAQQQRTLAVVLIALQHGESAPAPVHAMSLNKSVPAQFHRFDKIHLLPVRGCTRIFPDKAPAISQVTGTLVLSNWRLSVWQIVEKWFQLLCPRKTLLSVGLERALERGIRGIQGEQCRRVVVAQRLAPGEVYAFDGSALGIVHSDA